MNAWFTLTLLSNFIRKARNSSIFTLKRTLQHPAKLTACKVTKKNEFFESDFQNFPKIYLKNASQLETRRRKRKFQTERKSPHLFQLIEWKKKKKIIEWMKRLLVLIFINFPHALTHACQSEDFKCFSLPQIQLISKRDNFLMINSISSMTKRESEMSAFEACVFLTRVALKHHQPFFLLSQPLRMSIISV